MKYKFKHSILGGTFDRFHIGHKKLIDTAFSDSGNVTIGIGTVELYKDKFLAKTIEDYSARLLSVKAYLADSELLKRAEIIKINDIFGNTLEREDIDAIFATEKNLENIKIINVERRKRSFFVLKTVIVPYVLGEDGGLITSERIRKGEIDRAGNSYFGIFAKKKSLILPDSLRKTLRKPLGKVIKKAISIKKYNFDSPMLITIGDIVTLNLFMKGTRPDLSIFDLKTRRHKLNKEYEPLLKSFSKSQAGMSTVNPPGAIQRRSVGVIKKAIDLFLETSGKQTIFVKGEEDLLTLPAILLSPLNSLVLYGQPGEGIVVIKVTEKKKYEVSMLLNKMR